MARKKRSRRRPARPRYGRPKVFGVEMGMRRVPFLIGAITLAVVYVGSASFESLTEGLDNLRSSDRGFARPTDPIEPPTERKRVARPERKPPKKQAQEAPDRTAVVADPTPPPEPDGSDTVETEPAVTAQCKVTSYEFHESSARSTRGGRARATGTTESETTCEAG